MGELVELPSHPHPLKPCKMQYFSCEMCGRSSDSSQVDVYQCQTCLGDIFHKECAESPAEIKHPYHPRRPLTLSYLDDHHLIQLYSLDDDNPLRALLKCIWCRKLLGNWVFHCPLCQFFIHPHCAKEPPLLHVDHPKRHDHVLTLLPRPITFTCNACGLVDDPPFAYVCHLCDFMVHRDCIYLPRVIRISRHQHRLSRFPSLPSSQEWSCGVCRKVVHNDYGAYSCSKGCHYAVHPKCATRDDVWDGKELEEEPEEADEDVKPFEVIDGNVIHHFSHEHHLKLNEDDDVSDGGKHCQACGLPIHIHLGNLYSCTQCDCDFILHETCANLPRNIWYTQHPHRLKLHATKERTTAGCNVCYRKVSGFVYICCEKDCAFTTDVCCASVSEPFIHKIHPHPIFSTSLPLNHEACSGCKEEVGHRKMHCTECDFVLGFKCITLPPMVRYKHDKHPLVLSGGEDGEGTYWCETCEAKIDPKRLFYTCDSCCVTIHVECTLGDHPYMKTGQYSHLWLGKFEITANNSCSRPLCHKCKRRCSYPIVFKQNHRHFCTFTCL